MEITRLLIYLLVCHYLADYVLTTTRMIEAKSDGRQLAPILQHASVHALLMTGVVLLMNVGGLIALMVFLFEATTHFAIDTAKGRLTAAFPTLANSNRKPYWMLYGLDQMLHLMVVVAICRMTLLHL